MQQSFGHIIGGVFACCSQPRAHQQRYQQQETQGENGGKRQHVIAGEVPKPREFSLFHLPDHVESVLQLHHHPDGGEQKRSDTKGSGNKTGSRATCSHQHRFHSLRSGFAKHIFDRRHDLRGDGIVAEQQTCHRDGDDDNGT